MAASIPQQVIDYCASHKLCKGCKFVTGECVAPQSDRQFNGWIEKMTGLILKETANA